MPRYSITYDGWFRPADRDARCVALILWKDGDYHQFFQAVVSGFDLVMAKMGYGGDVRSAAAKVGAMKIEQEVRDGLVPLESPTTAIWIDVPINEVKSALSPGEVEPAEGHEVLAFAD